MKEQESVPIGMGKPQVSSQESESEPRPEGSGGGFALTGDDGFAEFKAAYPPEGWTHPERARAAWRKLTPGQRRKVFIMLPIQKASRRWADPQFIPNPASYCNGHYFDDDPKAYPRKVLTQDDRCEQCGRTWREHPVLPHGEPICPG